MPGFPPRTVRALSPFGVRSLTRLAFFVAFGFGFRVVMGPSSSKSHICVTAPANVGPSPWTVPSSVGACQLAHLSPAVAVTASLRVGSPAPTNARRQAGGHPKDPAAAARGTRHSVLRPKRSRHPRRVCLVGESVATGYFYAPHLTPAKTLENQLRHVGGAGSYEVVDLARVDMMPLAGPHSLVRVARSALQLRPDVLVVFAGNNWASSIRPFPGQSLAGVRLVAPAYREAGPCGLMRLCQASARQMSAEVIESLAGLARAASLPVVMVLPEVNQADWERAAPVAWLGGAASRRWYELLALARGHQRAGRHGAVAAIAERMIQLDEGTCSTSHRLLANARLAQGRVDDARRACLAEIDSRHWMPGVTIPGAGSVVREVVRRGVRRLGLTGVDLPGVFAQQASGLPDRTLFFDYCHLTRTGIKVAMAAVTAAVLRVARGSRGDTPGWRSLVAHLPDPDLSPARDATAKFLAAVYALHWDRRIHEESPLPEFWSAAALEAWDGIRETMVGYLATRAAPLSARGLSSAEQRFFGPGNRLEDGAHRLAGEGRRMRRPGLDAAAVDLICRVVERSGQPIPASLTRTLVENHGVPPGGADLVDLGYRWNANVDPDYQSDPAAYSAAGLHRAFWPVSDFAFVADGARPLSVEVTARVPRIEQPRAGERLGIEVNGLPAGALSVGARWGRRGLALPPTSIRRGINRLSLRWANVPPDGEAAMRTIAGRLERAFRRISIRCSVSCSRWWFCPDLWAANPVVTSGA